MSGDPGTRGYLHRQYAESLREVGTPRGLPGSGAWILERSIPGSDLHDAMGCYPLFCCRDWTALASDLAALESRLVTLTAVTDPFGNVDPQRLGEAFPDLVRPFKHHHVVDLGVPLDAVLGSHHRRNVRRGLACLEIERSETPAPWASEWTDLYARLIRRHAIRGVAAFSPQALGAQLAVPGAVAFRARSAGMTVGMVIWYVCGEVGYYHLGAYTPAGYEQRASFALFATAIGHFARSGLRWLSLGAGAGATGEDDDGLTRFKRGWSTGSRVAYLCGRILDPRAHARLGAAHGAIATEYFPAYRSGEFA